MIPLEGMKTIADAMGELHEGRIVKIHGGFSTVKTASGEQFQCHIRGRIKKTSAYLLVGDMVRFSVASGMGVIEQILPRLNELSRPQVANIHQLVSILSVHSPNPDWGLLNRQLVLAEINHTMPVICVNKVDLASKSDLDDLRNTLSLFPYDYIFTSALSGEGIEKLCAILKNRVSVFAGQSGVGKSTLLNRIGPILKLKTGELSLKGKRGKHTTRNVELLSLSFGGEVVDTPGFSKLEFELEDKDTLSLDSYFPEMKGYFPGCRFRNCNHQKEPGCAVIKAVENGLISPLRYQTYHLLLNELHREPERRL